MSTSSIKVINSSLAFDVPVEARPSSDSLVSFIEASLRFSTDSDSTAHRDANKRLFSGHARTAYTIFFSQARGLNSTVLARTTCTIRALCLITGVRCSAVYSARVGLRPWLCNKTQLLLLLPGLIDRLLTCTFIKDLRS